MSDHEAVRRRVKATLGTYGSIETPALDAFTERLRKEFPDKLAAVHNGENPTTVFWEFALDTLTWEDALPVLEELFELSEPSTYFLQDERGGVEQIFAGVEGPMDYLRLLLVHVAVARTFPMNEEGYMIMRPRS
ncbi:hypothetical protein [Actinomadura decatromicini]|uniref:Uncharacterized protein n=1 Tax=Actinomadura decatromicini TaxID=2604572 RepID=A0A5D3FA54_9ACTN|nr:hypothetical protein [Actinomadura decatromicini]TYK44570.1 hypothetical protein FXF68_34495 [Actinomadura decatromicini]